MTFFDANTFLNYNANMRQLVFDKVQMTQMVVFNRFKGEYDKMEFHKVGIQEAKFFRPFPFAHLPEFPV